MFHIYHGVEHFEVLEYLVIFDQEVNLHLSISIINKCQKIYIALKWLYLQGVTNIKVHQTEQL